MTEARLTHLNARGDAHIVDIAEKPPTRRRAVARARLEASPEAIAAILEGALGKGDALAAARIAGIMAAKRTAELIPLCHPIALTSVDVQVESAGPEALVVTASAEATDRTGVEMEAMTAASIAALTLYDMAKSMDRAMSISSVVLLEKSGGRSGDYRRTSQ